jgi:nucleotide-binding universal stress UspA family protein
MRQPPPRILFAASNAGAQADSLERMAALARTLHAELHVLRVLADLHKYAPWTPSDHLIDDGASLDRFTAACRETRAWSQELLQRDLTDERWQVRIGAFVPEVAEHARALNASLIVLAPEHARMGALVTELVSASALPVLLARGRTTGTAIIAATDLRDRRYPVLDRASVVAERLAAHLVVVHNAGTNGLPARLASLLRALKSPESDFDDNCTQRLAEAVSHLRPDAEAVVAGDFDPVEAILRHARSRDADIIVVGAHARSSLRRLVASGVAARVVDRARRSVLVTPLDGLSTGSRTPLRPQPGDPSPSRYTHG